MAIYDKLIKNISESKYQEARIIRKYPVITFELFSYSGIKSVFVFTEERKPVVVYWQKEGKHKIHLFNT